MPKVTHSGIYGWTPERLSDLSGKLFVITGGNSGIGLGAAKLLAAKNADIVIACRNEQKAEAAVAEIDAEGSGTADYVLIDLASLASVRKAAKTIAKANPKIDALVLNAGLSQNRRSTTEEGFETTFAVNYLGHFLLAGLLLKPVEAAKGRIVTVASIVHKYVRLKLDDLMFDDRFYTVGEAYSQSKLANLMFALECDRRLSEKGSDAISLACHPGFSATNIQDSGGNPFAAFFGQILNWTVAQSAERGAYPTVLAAADGDARRGGYYGPTGLFDANGPVGDAEVRPHALDRHMAKRLWAKSEELIGLKWP